MIKKIIFLTLLCFVTAGAQSYKDSLQRVEEAFKNFRYGDVINMSADLLKQGSLSSGDLIKVYMMKGISHFSLQEDTLAKFSFREILKLDHEYYPDTLTTSPKILRFFEEVRKNYMNSLNPQQQQYPLDTLQVLPGLSEPVINPAAKIRTSYLRSLLFPGLGHIYAGDPKGWYITAAAGISLASSVYFTIRTNEKRNDYLGEKDPAGITSKYNEYNTSYRIRNASILLFAAVWIYSQVDILISPLPEITITEAGDFAEVKFLFRL